MSYPSPQTSSGWFLEPGLITVDEALLEGVACARLEEGMGREGDIIRRSAGNLQEHRRVVAVAANYGLVNTRFTKLLDESADFVRTGGDVEHVGGSARGFGAWQSGTRNRSFRRCTLSPSPVSWPPSCR